MNKQLVSITVALMLLAASLPAEEREVLKTDWRGFQEQVSTRKLEGRNARIAFSGGEEIRVKVLGVTETAVIVRDGRAVKQWSSGGKQASIPKDQVTAARFEGRIGRGRAIGTVAGVAGAAAIAGALVAKDDDSEGPLALVIPAIVATVIPIGAMIGYFTGKARDRRAPEFILTQ